MMKVQHAKLVRVGNSTLVTIPSDYIKNMMPKATHINYEITEYFAEGEQDEKAAD
jgi:hypothetical protein